MTKVDELTGAELDYWVARAEGYKVEDFPYQTLPCKIIYNENELVGYIGGFMDPQYMPSLDWRIGGPIIDRLNIDVITAARYVPNDNYAAFINGSPRDCDDPEGEGPTRLIAICRAVVRSVFGDEVGGMKYVIRYTDGVYEWRHGFGNPCSLDGARRFDTLEEAEQHAALLIDVDSIVEVAE